MAVVRSSTLRSLLEHFPKESTSYVFGYGSGVFPQKNQKMGKMIDLVFVVDNSYLWHEENLQMNPGHYSFLRRFGASAISRIQERWACGVYYNPFVTVDGKVIKYGVISTDALNDDLVNWRHMYIAGRLQKPVHDIKPPSSSKMVNNIKFNRMAALRAVLLQLPQYTTKYELYYGITALSYMGDFRMYVGEHPHKIKNIVVPLMPEFDKVYLPLLHSLGSIVTIDEQKSTIIQRHGKDAKVGHLLSLPAPLQIRLAQKYKYNLARYDVEEVMYHISKQRNIDKSVLQVLSKIVASSSVVQTLQGVLTAGIVKSVVYGFEKIMKKVKAGGSAKREREEKEAASSAEDAPHNLTSEDIAELKLEEADIQEAEAEIADAIRIAVIRTSFTSATVLLHAIYLGDLEHIKLLDESKADWTVKDPNRCNVIHFAVAGENPTVLMYVLSRLSNGAINEKDIHGWSPLLRAVTLTDNSELIKMLLDNGADPNATDHDNSRSCLFIAALMGKAEVVKRLLDYKANPFYTNMYGKTPIGMAHILKRKACIEILSTAMKKVDPNADVDRPSAPYTNERLMLNDMENKLDQMEADVKAIAAQGDKEPAGAKSSESEVKSTQQHAPTPAPIKIRRETEEVSKAKQEKKSTS